MDDAIHGMQGGGWVIYRLLNFVIVFFHLPIFSENENKTTEKMGHISTNSQKTCSIDNAIHRMQGGVLSQL